MRTQSDIEATLAQLQTAFTEARAAVDSYANQVTWTRGRLAAQHAYCEELYAQVVALEWVLGKRKTLPTLEAV